MPIKSAQTLPIIIVNVAVAVIHYQEQYLLGFRSGAQHQGNRYEFVGGKIESNETTEAALIREVAEETGIDISDNVAVKLGRLHHDYGDKQVCLQVYKVALTAKQYEQHRHCDYGLEGQALTWVAKAQLLAGEYPLPAANKTILAWLQLPEQIVITYPLAHFGAQPDIQAAWLDYHQQHLPIGAWVYIRIKAAELIGSQYKISETDLAATLMRLRSDIHSILPAEYGFASQNNQDNAHHSAAYHLTHTQLMTWFNATKKEIEHNPLILPLQPLIISCHDIDSITAANQLANMRLEQQQPPVIGIFLSPVLATQSHPDVPALGWRKWSSLAQLADSPVIGLGGLSPALSQQATHYGAISIAGIRNFF